MMKSNSVQFVPRVQAGKTSTRFLQPFTCDLISTHHHYPSFIKPGYSSSGINVSPGTALLLLKLSALEART